MLRFASILAFLSVVAPAAFAQPGPTYGEIELTHGWVKRADGTKVSVKGMKLPCVVYPIYAKNMTLHSNPAERTVREALANTLRGGNGNPLQMGPEADSVIYQADAGTGYGYVENCPSSLDDITISNSGLNKPWTKLKFGFNTTLGSNPRFLVRWRVFKTNVDFPAPQNDFTDEIADFGGKFEQPIPGPQVIVEVNIQQAGVVSDDDTLFIAQQFREFSNPPTQQQLNGEGAFMYGTVDCVFNPFAPPTTGTSDGSIFWYDWDPFPDGNYENTEIDTFDGGLANHLFGITVNSSGSSQSFNPLSVTTIIGKNTLGSVLSTWIEGDGDVYSIQGDYTGARETPIGRIEMSVPAPTSFTGIRAQGVCGTDFSSLRQRVELYHVTTNTWVKLNEKTINWGVNSFNDAYGGTLQMAGFRASNGMVKFRVSWDTPPGDGTRTSRMWIDMFRAYFTN